MIGPVIQGLARLGLWGGAAAAGGIALETATDQDGKGGTVFKFGQNLWKKWTEMSSSEQGRNTLLDAYNAGIAKFSGIMGFLMPIVALISPALGEKMKAWVVGQSVDMTDRSKDLADTGPAHETVLSPETEATYNGVTSKLENAWPDAIDQGNPHLATAATAATGLGAAWVAKTGIKSLFGGATAGPAAGGIASSLMGSTPIGRVARLATLAVGVTAASMAADEAQEGVTPPVAGAPSTAAASATPTAVSLTQDPAGFVQSLADGVGSVFTEENWRNGENFDALANNGKAFATGAATGTAWVAGQAVDTVDTVLDYGLNYFGFNRDFTDDYSTKFTEVTNDGANYVSDNFLGGAPDMSGAWAQAANFTGGFVAPAGVTAKAGKILGGIFRSNAATASATAATTTTAAPSIPAAGPVLRMGN